MTNLTRLRLILVDLSGLMKKKTYLKQNILFVKHFSGPEFEILEFDWLLTRVLPVQFFPIRTGFVVVTARINHAKTIE